MSGEAPYGWRLVRHEREGWRYEPVAEEIEVIRLVREWRERGASWERICAYLEDSGAKPRCGGEWVPGLALRAFERGLEPPRLPAHLASVNAALARRAEQPSEFGAEVINLADYRRPKTRAECEDGPRPCPWVGCRWNLYLHVNRVTGAIEFSFPELEPWELPETCALDVADRGGLPLEEVGRILGISKQRVEQIETRALGKLRGQLEEWADYVEPHREREQS